MNNPYSMSDESDPSVARHLGPSVRIVQIITFALLQGAFLFGCIALFLNSGDINGVPSLLTWVAVGVSGLMVVNHFVVPRIIAGAMIRNLAANGLAGKTLEEKATLVMGVFQSQHIIGCAMLEGAAFLCLVVYLVESTQYALGCAVLLLCIIAARFPTTSGVQFWVENRIREVDLS